MEWRASAPLLERESGVEPPGKRMLTLELQQSSQRILPAGWYLATDPLASWMNIDGMYPPSIELDADLTASGVRQLDEANTGSGGLTELVEELGDLHVLRLVGSLTASYLVVREALLSWSWRIPRLRVSLR